jgi:hypothetical protein
MNARVTLERFLRAVRSLRCDLHPPLHPEAHWQSWLLLATLCGWTAMTSTGCATAHAVSIVGPDGSPMLHVSCERNRAECYQIAGRHCPSGYDIQPAIGSNSSVLVRCTRSVSPVAPVVVAEHDLAYPVRSWMPESGLPPANPRPARHAAALPRAAERGAPPPAASFPDPDVPAPTAPSGVGNQKLDLGY